MNLTVGDILAVPGLEALRLRAGQRHCHRPVRWYYVAENEGTFTTGDSDPTDYW